MMRLFADVQRIIREYNSKVQVGLENQNFRNSKMIQDLRQVPFRGQDLLAVTIFDPM